MLKLWIVGDPLRATYPGVRTKDGGKAIKIYIAAASYRQKEARNAYRKLQRRGFEVTSSWVFKRSLGEIDSFPYEAHRDLEQVAEADVVVTFSENPRRKKYTTGGRHVECGYALAKGKELIVVGPRENVFHYLPYVKQYDTLQEAMEYLRGEK